MLKIKDNVDLEKLFQKYDFIQCYGSKIPIGLKQLKNNYCDTCWFHIDKNRIIGLETVGDFSDFDTLYDLIKADLVEKVDE